MMSENDTRIRQVSQNTDYKSNRGSGVLRTNSEDGDQCRPPLLASLVECEDEENPKKVRNSLSSSQRFKSFN